MLIYLYMVYVKLNNTICGVFVNYSSKQIVWQEVPGEVSLAYTISGCPLRCPGCHSADTWPLGAGEQLHVQEFKAQLRQYSGLITCVLFLGGEWHEQRLLELLEIAQNQGLNTCLYTGQETVSDALKARLTYLKTGPWVKQLGGLDSATSNQRLIDLRTNECLNRFF